MDEWMNGQMAGRSVGSDGLRALEITRKKLLQNNQRSKVVSAFELI